MTSLSKAEELKELGNICMKAQLPDYNKAILLYTEALAVDENNHLVLGNRSLANYKLGKFEDALTDAERAVCIAPKWAKGYLRKCAALASLKRYEEVFEVAQNGFQLMHSTALCQEFVFQWIKACHSHFSQFNCEVPVPTGGLILSPLYFQVLYSSHVKRESAIGTTMQEMKKSLLAVVDEFERIISGFGEPHQSCMRQWAEVITMEMDPTVTTVSQDVLKSSVHVTEKFVEYLNSSLHMALYPIARPLVLLSIIVISSRCHTLNTAHTNGHCIQFMNSMCLPLFEKSILNTPDYVGMHIGMLIGLIQSYAAKAERITDNDATLIAQHCDKMESLLRVYPPDQREYTAMKNLAEGWLFAARNVLEACQKGDVLPSHGKNPLMMTRDFVPRDIDVLRQPKELKQYLQKLIQQLKHKPIIEYSIEDAENLVNSSDALLKLGDSEGAKEALNVAENVFVNTFAMQLVRGTVNLDEFSVALGTARFTLLRRIALVKEIDSKLAVDIAIRWKCLFSQFRSMLVYKGLGNIFLSTFKAVQNALITGNIQGLSTNTKITADIAKAHEKLESEFVKKHAFQCFRATIEISTSFPLEYILEPDEMVIDFVTVGDFNSKLDRVLSVYAAVVMPDGERLIEEIDCSAVIDGAWVQLLNKSAADITEDVDLALQKQLQKSGKELCCMLFPSSIIKHILKPEVKHIYIGSDLLHHLPFILLPGPDGSPLFKNCTLSHVNSSSELLQKVISVRLNALEEQQQEQTPTLSGMQHSQVEPSKQNEPQSSTLQQSAAQVPKYMCEKTLSDHTECYIFADPNYDLHTSNSGFSLWETFANLWKPTVPKIEKLPNTLSEAKEVASILADHPEFKVHVVTGDDATVTKLMKLESPFILHISTHGYVDNDHSVRFRRNFWDDTKSGFIMAGYNTYHEEKYNQITPEAGTGMLNSLGASGLKLTDTRLVFLSLCKSGLGPQKLQEASGSLANALRAAGARTVIASLWDVADKPTAELVKQFYTHVLTPGIRPSEALASASKHVSSNPSYHHWYNWAGFACYGIDLPIFPIRN